MNDLSADILHRIQRAPGRWTIDQLAAATGLLPSTIAAAVGIGTEVGTIERPDPIDIFAPEIGFRTVTLRPTKKRWVEPCNR